MEKYSKIVCIKILFEWLSAVTVGVKKVWADTAPEDTICPTFA